MACVIKLCGAGRWVDPTKTLALGDLIIAPRYASRMWDDIIVNQDTKISLAVTQSKITSSRSPKVPRHAFCINLLKNINLVIVPNVLQGTNFVPPGMTVFSTFSGLLP
eukprot:CAMPEP_0195516326 /NCGR_PEP_ID=MMETSP0794_2-20130614/7084_1 /TAXON_ID=515487 /ORGANISM="Stephanopyxis turris, Strain CCMP 815" /LENGTH=107 /DNA_ID=CAMNT_0040644893 /DNA_START=1009 /DNA_END=1332 /DNA_ORIENTATION=+